MNLKEKCKLFDKAFASTNPTVKAALDELLVAVRLAEGDTKPSPGELEKLVMKEEESAMMKSLKAYLNDYTRYGL